MTRASIGAGAEGDGARLPAAGRRGERTMVMQDGRRRELLRSQCRREPSRPAQATLPQRPRPRSRMARAGARAVLRRRAANVGLSNGAREIDWLMSGGKEPAGLGVSRHPVRSGTQFLLTGSIPATRCRRAGIGPPFLGGHACAPAGEQATGCRSRPRDGASLPLLRRIGGANECRSRDGSARVPRAVRSPLLERVATVGRWPVVTGERA